MSTRAKRPLAPDDPRHGTRTGYGYWGCRCEACRAANTAAAQDHWRRSPPAMRARVIRNINARRKQRNGQG